ncbi:MAG: PEP-CTERM sorting domain-containing protein [Opitutales bacterium]
MNITSAASFILATLAPTFAFAGGTVFDAANVDFESDDNGLLSAGQTNLDFSSVGLVSISFIPTGAYNGGNFDPGQLLPMVFDTNNPTGNDGDLLTPSAQVLVDLGNVLIISEDNDSSDPDDLAGGGVLRFVFDQLVSFDELGILDNEESDSRAIGSAGGVEIFNTAIPGGADGNYQVLALPEAPIDTLDVLFDGSGAVALLSYKSTSVPEPGVYGAVGIIVIGLTVLRRRRQGISS